MKSGDWILPLLTAAVFGFASACVHIPPKSAEGLPGEADPSGLPEVRADPAEAEAPEEPAADEETSTSETAAAAIFAAEGGGEKQPSGGEPLREESSDEDPIRDESIRIESAAIEPAALEPGCLPTAQDASVLDEAALAVDAAAARLEEGDASGAIYRLASVIAVGPETGGAPFERARRILDDLCSHLSVDAAEGWKAADRWRLLPKDPYSEPPPPAFRLRFDSGEAVVPVSGLFFEVRVIVGEAPFGDLGLTDRRGFGSIGLPEDGIPERTALRISFFVQVGEYRHSLAVPVFYFVYPAPALLVDVRNGERVKSFLQRLVEWRLTTAAALQAVAAEVEYPQWDFVPPVSGGINRFEGLFVPGEYSFLKRDVVQLGDGGEIGDEELARRNAERIVEELLSRSEKRYASEQGDFDRYEQIILASIVEKEAVSNADYEIVASVFQNRMAGGSKLASCPTVEYALDYHRPFLTYEDIAVDSPYNVYVRKGLPPTPICFFTDEALEAVRNPADTDYYYFVYDWTTEQLYFASRYDDHLANASRSRSNYTEKHGKESLYEIRYDKYYEP